MLFIAVPLHAADPSICDRSVQHILRGQYDAALRQLEGARTGGSSPAEVENVRGLALLLRGDPSEALAAFEKALAANPKLSEARLNRGLTHLRLGSFAKASADFGAVAADEASPVRADAAYHNGIALDRLGRTQEAEAMLDRALRLDPALDAALLYRGMLAERRGDLQSAGRSYLDYLDRHPKSVVAMLRFGVAAQKSGRFETAKTWLQRVIAASPESPEAAEARKFLVMWD